MAEVVRRGHVNPNGLGSSIRVDASLAQTAVNQVVTPQVENLQEQLNLLADILAAQRDVRHMEIDLRRGRRGGSLLVEPSGGFTEDQVGGPVLMTLAPTAQPDEAEGAVVTFTARVLNERQMRVWWSSAAPAPRRVNVNYMVSVR